MTKPSVVKLLLMFPPSFKRIPVIPDFAILSLKIKPDINKFSQFEVLITQKSNKTLDRQKNWSVSLGRRSSFSKIY